MARIVRYVCPVTRKAHIVSDDNDPTVGEVLEENPLEDLPGGWGEFRVRQVLPNPEYAQIMAMRQTALAGLDAQIQSAIASGEGTPPTADEVAVARRAVEDEVDSRYPVPPETVCVEWTLGECSPEAMQIVLDALKVAGVHLKITESSVAPAEA